MVLTMLCFGSVVVGGVCTMRNINIIYNNKHGKDVVMLEVAPGGSYLVVMTNLILNLPSF